MSEFDRIYDKMEAMETRLHGKIESTEEKIQARIECLDKKLMNPDDGLFARVKKNTNFRRTARKIFVALSASVLGILIKIIHEGIKKFFSGSN